MTHPLEHSSTLPPPYNANEVGRDISLIVYASLAPQPSTSSSSHLATVLHFKEAKRTRYSVLIPKKREGWKAEVALITEKDRSVKRCEIRREPLARRYDFRDPDGNHNVMIPSTTLTQKTFAIESPDGQKLLWRRVRNQWEMLSMPSQTLLASYTIFNETSDQYPSESGFQARGKLDIVALPSAGPADIRPMSYQKLERTQSRSTTSSSSSEGPRLGKGYKTLSLGLCAPGIIGAAFASPFAAAALNRHCSIGDELTNLGRAMINVARSKPEMNDTTITAGASWVHMNEAPERGKNNDPRPRMVDHDAIVSMLVAVLAG